MYPKIRPYFLKWIFLLCCFSFQAQAAEHPKQQEALESIGKLYHTLARTPNADMASRLELISAQFLGKPYLLGALGEGAGARFDQWPLYRVDAFDCDTYVNTVLALALAHNQDTFPSCLRKLRYKNGKVDFITRNHFTSLDWNLNNQKVGLIRDFTEEIKDKNKLAIAQIAQASIDKPSWYAHFSLKKIRLIPPNEQEQQLRLTQLKTEGKKLSPQIARITYLPLSQLFDQQGNPNSFLFAQIPHGAIIEIVRPNWDLTQTIGTHLNVSHLGFAFWKNSVLYFRQASSVHEKVVDVSLVDYLREKLNSPTIKGIHIEVVVPTQPLCGSK